MTNETAIQTHPFPSVWRIIVAGIVGGIVLNLIDTPWSILVMVPRMQKFLDEHSLTTSPLAGPWFLTIHLAYTTAIAYLYSLIRSTFGGGFGNALLAGILLLSLNRAFGFANVLLGTIPATVFFGFSVSMVIGTLVASILCGRIIDGSAR